MIDPPVVLRAQRVVATAKRVGILPAGGGGEKAAGKTGGKNAGETIAGKKNPGAKNK